MPFISTSRKSPEVSLREAVLSGHAPDGGLYMPSRIPVLPRAFFNNMPDMSLPEIAYVVSNTLFSEGVDAGVLSRLASEIFTFPVPSVRLGASLSGLELFHGPSGSFNDIGARFLAGLLPYLGLDPSRPVNFLMATTGDSGAAIALALKGMPGARVTVLYPHNRISRERATLLARLNGGNVTVASVSGDTDDCRAMVREVFADSRLVNLARLTPASSVNIARFLPQIFVFFHAYAIKRAHGDTRDVVVGVPGGNLANLAAGLVAKRMGLPLKRLVVSDRSNSQYATSLRGSGDRHSPNSTTPLNLPRILSLYDGDTARMGANIEERLYTDAEIARSINLNRAAGYMIEASSASACQALNDSVDPSCETGVSLIISKPDTAEPSAAPREPVRPPVSIGRSMQALRSLLLDAR